MGEVVPLLSSQPHARRFFDSLAPWYDRINARLYRPEWLAKVRAALVGPRVLDVGVGTGFTTGHLEAAVGIDLSREMLGRARYRGHLLRADFLRAPFRYGVFDTIVFAGSFYYLPDPGAGLSVASRLLRAEGRIVLLSPATPILAPFVPIYSKAGYEAMFREAGFDLVSYERLSRAACLVVAQRT